MSSSSTNGADSLPPFDHSSTAHSEAGGSRNEGFHFTQLPNPSWKVGDGLSPANGSIPSDVYDLFVRSRTKKGQEELFKTLDPASMEPGKIYQLMIGGIAPRPIGFCSSMDEEGNANLAPFSYFAPCGHQPPIVMLSFTTTSRKDSCENIKKTKQFTVNIISEPFVEAANYTSVDLPADLSEWAVSGLTQAPSTTVKPPRVAESAYTMECELEHFYDINSPKDGKRTGTVILGRVKLFHVRSDILQERGGIDLARLLPVSRLGGTAYGRTTQAYSTPRPKYAEEKEKPEFEEALRRGPRQLDTAEKL